MAYIDTIPPERATGEVRSMYERQRAALGYVPNYARLFSHRPELMARWARLLAGVRRVINPRRFELVTLAAAQTMGSSYCTLAHTKALLEHYSALEVRSIVTGDELGPLSEPERVMMAFARKVAGDPTAVGAADVAALESVGFADEEIFDIVATVAARAFFTTLLDGLGAQPDAAYAALGTELLGAAPSRTGGARTLSRRDPKLAL